MNQFNPLKYRGVFDYPIIQTKNLLGERKYVCRRVDFEQSPENGFEITPVENVPTTPSNPPNTSGHVLEFMGWSGGAKGTGRRKPTYLGVPTVGRILDQKEAWIQIWLQKGRYEHEKEQLRLAAQRGKEASGVSSKKSTQR